MDRVPVHFCSAVVSIARTISSSAADAPSGFGVWISKHHTERVDLASGNLFRATGTVTLR